jgi:hypothetical protein
LPWQALPLARNGRLATAPPKVDLAEPFEKNATSRPPLAVLFGCTTTADVAGSVIVSASTLLWADQASLPKSSAKRSAARATHMRKTPPLLLGALEVVLGTKTVR